MVNYTVSAKDVT